MGDARIPAFAGMTVDMGDARMPAGAGMTVGMGDARMPAGAGMTVDMGMPGFRISAFAGMTNEIQDE